jgi:hypothetical protein
LLPVCGFAEKILPTPPSTELAKPDSMRAMLIARAHSIPTTRSGHDHPPLFMADEQILAVGLKNSPEDNKCTREAF